MSGRSGAVHDDPDKEFANTLARGLELLLCFAPGESALRNKDFVQRTGLDKATVSRLAYTLDQLGYLRHDAADGKYRLGAAVLAMGYPLLANMSLRHVVRPWIKSLADEVRGTVSILIRDRTSMVYMETCRSEQETAPLVDIGASLPIIASTSGRAWLARTTPQERDKVLNQVKVLYPKLYAEQIAKVRRTLGDLAQRGYLSGPGLVQPERVVVAVPMARPVNAEIIVFNCAVAPQGRPVEPLRAHLGARLITLARGVEIAMGLA